MSSRVEHLTNPAGELGRGKRLFEKLETRLQDAAPDDGILGIARDIQDAKAGLQRLELTGDFSAGRPGEHHIGDQQINRARAGLRGLQGLFTRGRRRDVVALLGQDADEELSELRFILDDENRLAAG